MLPLIYFALGIVATVVVGYPLLRARQDKTPAPAAEAPATETTTAPRMRRIPGPVIAGVGVAVVLAASAVLYFRGGGAENPSQQTTAAAGPTTANGGLPDVDTMIDRLAKRLEAKPNDPEGWRMLGWSYFATQHYQDAAKAYGRAVALKPDDAGYQSAYGEALTKAASDKITPDAEKAFAKALASDPKDTRARVYQARLKAQKGQNQAALDDLFALLKQSANPQMDATIKEAIRKVSNDSGIDVSSRLPAEAPGPTAADVQAAQAMAPQDRQAMIDGMVSKLEARLAASPRDADGWIMLIRSHKQLGHDEQASAALKKGLAAFADDAATRQKISDAATQLGVR